MHHVCKKIENKPQTCIFWSWRQTRELHLKKKPNATVTLQLQLEFYITNTISKQIWADKFSTKFSESVLNSSVVHVLTQPKRIFLYELIAPAAWQTGVHLRKLGRWGSETLLLTNHDFWTCFHHFSSYKIFFNEDTAYLPHKVYFIKPIIQQHEQLTIRSTIVFAWGIHKNIKEQRKLKNGAGELKPCWQHAEQTGTIES